jgi:hypothetical protein
MKMYGAGAVKLLVLLNSLMNGEEWSASRPGRFVSGKKTAATHWIGDCLMLPAIIYFIYVFEDALSGSNCGL